MLENPNFYEMLTEEGKMKIKSILEDFGDIMNDYIDEVGEEDCLDITIEANIYFGRNQVLALYGNKDYEREDREKFVEKWNKLYGEEQ